ncbi:MAG TPA: flavin reductase family protein [Trebonia sp.]|nr:flavin reductase family protein [Trebonia sp.]
MTRSDGQPIAAALPDARELRRTLGRFATGITVVTVGREEPRGMTVNAFSSLSLDPPLVLVCVVRNATLHDLIRESGSFAVSVLAAHQERVARLFADRTRARGTEFAEVDSIPGPYTGAPVLSGALAWLECKLTTVYDGGDHSIFIGEVQTLRCGETEDALLFYKGGFHRLEQDILMSSTV